jgi:hypothetical protein
MLERKWLAKNTKLLPQRTQREERKERKAITVPCVLCVLCGKIQLQTIPF